MSPTVRTPFFIVSVNRMERGTTDRTALAELADEFEKLREAQAAGRAGKALSQKLVEELKHTYAQPLY